MRKAQSKKLHVQVCGQGARRVASEFSSLSCQCGKLVGSGGRGLTGGQNVPSCVLPASAWSGCSNSRAADRQEQALGLHGGLSHVL